MVRIVEPSVEIISPRGRGEAIRLLKVVEMAGRICYGDKSKTTDDSYIRFIKMLIAGGHESVIEHAGATVRIVCDRGISHELVRHRIASFSQESTRYCKYGDEIVVIEPPTVNAASRSDWFLSIDSAEKTYRWMLEAGEAPQIARSVLPNCLKTELYMTANLREWRYILQLRGSKAAHPQMREIVEMLLPKMQLLFSPVFDKVSGICYT